VLLAAPLQARHLHITFAIGGPLKVEYFHITSAFGGPLKAVQATYTLRFLMGTPSQVEY